MAGERNVKKMPMLEDCKVIKPEVKDLIEIEGIDIESVSHTCKHPLFASPA